MTIILDALIADIHARSELPTAACVCPTMHNHLARDLGRPAVLLPMAGGTTRWNRFIVAGVIVTCSPGLPRGAIRWCF